MIDLELMTVFNQQAEESLHKLSSTVLEGVKPEPGPYGFFNHCSQALGRLKDCYFITRRLYEGRNKLNEAELGDPSHSAEKHKITTELNHYMQLDMESLYTFSGILIDQWAILALYITGVQKPEKYRHPFHEVVQDFEKGANKKIQVIWDNYKPLMLWLDYQVRFYRNRFVVHSDRPWQRGTTRSVIGDDFNLFIPSPPGWLNDEEINKEILQLSYLLPDEVLRLQEDDWVRKPRAIIERLFNSIGEISSKEERERIARLFGKVGGSTPSFQFISQKVNTFILLGTNLLIEVASNNMESVNIGRPREG